MRTFNYSAIKEQKWDSDVLGLIAAIYKEAGKQELYLKQRPEELEKLVEIAKIQSTEASNAIEGIVTTSTRIRQLVEEKTTPRNRDCLLYTSTFNKSRYTPPAKRLVCLFSFAGKAFFVHFYPLFVNFLQLFQIFSQIYEFFPKDWHIFCYICNNSF